MSNAVAAIVLAAGAGRRFGGGKLLARLEGKAILQHVLDALASAGIGETVVVVGDDEAALDTAIDWRSARRVRNPQPQNGLSSSLHIGWGSVMAGDPRPDVVLVVLGDQPRLDPLVVSALLEQPIDPTRPVIVAVHADGARNPVRLEPEAGGLVAAATGDRGLGPLLDSRPDLVRELRVGGTNPDIDTHADLVTALTARWQARVVANKAQVDRVREVADGSDFYATVHKTFVADPARADDPVLQALLDIALPGERWLDVGAGAGRYALPIARRVGEVIAVDPSASMLGALSEGMAAHGVSNVAIHRGTWPPEDALRTVLGPDPVADVTLIAHVGYDIAEIEPFIDALEAAARRRCVAVLMEDSPASVAAPFWPPVHGEERVPLPALPEFVELVTARGTTPKVSRVHAERRRWADRAELLAFLRRQLWTSPGGPADERLVSALDQLTAPERDGGLGIIGARPLDIGIVTWTPAESR